MKCGSGLGWRNPYGPDIVIACARGAHLPADQDHAGLHPNGVTTVRWHDADRRSFDGEFPGWCARTPGCVLPSGHRMDGSGCAT